MNNNQNGNAYTGYNNNNKNNFNNSYNNNTNGYSFSPKNSGVGLPQQNLQYQQQAPPPPPPHHYAQQQQQQYPPSLPRLPENYHERDREQFLRSPLVSQFANSNNSYNTDSDDSPTAPLSPHLPSQPHRYNADDQSDQTSLESSDISARLRKSGSLFRRPQTSGQYSFGNSLSPSSSIKSSSRFGPRSSTGSNRPLSNSPSPTQSRTDLSATSTGSSAGMMGIPLNETTTATSIPSLPAAPTHFDLGRTPSGNPSAFRSRLGPRSQRIIGNTSSPFQRRHGAKGSIGSRSTMSNESNEQDEMNDTIAPLGMFKAVAKKEKKEGNGVTPEEFSDRRASTSSIVSDSSVLNLDLPTDMKLIVDSRPSNMVHDMVTFDNSQYAEFWGLTASEAVTFKKWNEIEFSKQCKIFEYFLLLKKVRANVKRMVGHYGVEFKKAKRLTTNQSSDYEKTFVPLAAFGEYLEKLVVSRLKPVFDNNFFVNDKYVVEISLKWFTKLVKDYEYISRSMVYLATLSTSILPWIEEAEQTDEERNNRYLISAKDLFTSYFLRFLTPVGLMVVDLKKMYVKSHDDKMTEMADRLYNVLHKINEISDYTTDLDKKIGLNNMLVCSDNLYLEMVNLFAKERKARVGIKVDLQSQIGWDHGGYLHLFDNYFLPLTQSSKRGEEKYTLNKPPVPLQYATFTTTNTKKNEIDDPKYLTVQDCGNMATYMFRYWDPEASRAFESFSKDCEAYKNNLFSKLCQAYYLKVVNCTSFYWRSPHYSYEVPPAPLVYDLASTAIEACHFKPNSPNLPPAVEAKVLSIDCFKSTNSLLFAVGTSVGIYLGMSDNPASWKKVCSYPNVFKITIVDNSIMYCQCHSRLYQVNVDTLSKYYSKRISVCDSEFKHIADHIQSFEIGFQRVRRGPRVETALHLFYWKEKKIKYSVLSAENKYKLKFSEMKATFQVIGLSFLYPKDFAISHINESNPIFYLSNLTSMTNTQLPKLDDDKELKSRVREEKPIAAFKYQLGTDVKEYDILLIYSQYCVFASYSDEYSCYRKSRNETLRFGFKVTDATFDPADGSLVICGDQSAEIWSISSNRDIKSSMVSCVIGKEVRLLNKTPGKIMLGLTYNGSSLYGGLGNQLILHVRKNKSGKLFINARAEAEAKAADKKTKRR
ncbi:unnamed protein product [Ambrosiozyma monospora]|uniref:Unnamed protein product n=1 Tax=Ambrosiozyma monospora TaxID=43982 RepID=A0A9W6YRE9_AMBMO|nr:unnamed protein product [Ambrosiozyma monospora]